MRAMLRRLALDGYATETIRRILTVFPRSSFGAADDGYAADVAARLGQNQPAIGRTFDPRELEVLELLRKNLSVKQIASELFLSPLTVKRHCANIFGKLGVHRRRDAVAQAEMVGLLSS